MIARRSMLAWLSLAAPMTLLRCAPPPKPPAVLTLTMVGSAEQNPSTAGKASPVAVRIYQLAATAKFERGDVFALTEHEQQTLGTDDAGSEEVVLSPGETQTKTIELKPGVQAIGLVVLYRDVDRSQWRAVAPVATSGPTKLLASIGKLAVTLKQVM